MNPSRKLLGFLCLLVLPVILTLGLWPFRSPANDVRWREGSNGLLFGGAGTLVSSGVFSSTPHRAVHTVEIWASAEDLEGGSTLLTFQNTVANCAQVSVERSQADLEVRTRLAKNYFQITKRDLYADNVFREREPVFITITSGPAGSQVYSNGQLVREAPNFRLLQCGFEGRLIAGDSAGQSNGWSGGIYGVAVYGRELDGDRIRRHFESWTRSGKPLLEAQDENILLYLFDEGKGRVAHDRAGGRLDLEIPERYMVVDKAILPGFWDEFNPTPGYWQDVLNNIIGFIPVGLCFSAYFTAASFRRPLLTAILCGVALSLTIECLQPFLATRESGTTDLMTNTLGTGLGVRLLAWFGKRGFLRLGSITETGRQ